MFLRAFAAAIGALLLLSCSQSEVRSDWSIIGGDLTNQRHSPIEQINLGNVAKLSGAWVSEPFPAGGSSRATPVIHDGLMFINAGAGVHALDATNGKVVWSWLSDPQMASKMTMQVQPGFVPNFQGVSIGDGRVYVGMMNGTVTALNEKTGAVLWNKHIGEGAPRFGELVSSPPVYFNGVLIAGLGSGDAGVNGRIVALEAATGKILWSFNVIPRPGEFGSETWPKDSDIWKIGGGGVWNVGTIDPELGLVYFTVGNSVPQWGGEEREGDNLFTSAIVALDIKTGRRKWHFQPLHHDLWDADIAVAPVNYDLEIDGVMRKGVAVMRPDGHLFLLDRATGKPLVPIEERPVPQNPRSKSAKTQPFPVGGESLLPDCSYWKGAIPNGFVCQDIFFPPSFPPPSSDLQNVLAPVFAVRTSPMAYDPGSGLFFARGTARLSLRRRADDPRYFSPFMGFVPETKSEGFLAAYDARTSKIVWKQAMAPEVLGSGGPLTTAGGLLFRLAGDGNFVAHDIKTGNIVWQFQTGHRGGNGHPAAYEVDGVQYVAVPVGPVVWAFKLDGKIPAATSSTPTAGGRGGGGGAFSDTKVVDTTSVAKDMGLLGDGNGPPRVREITDPFTPSPARAQVSVGSTLTFRNTGKQTTTFTAVDGSWTTGPIPVGGQRQVRFDKPGLFVYASKEIPWVYGQIRVRSNQVAANGVYTEEQAVRGRQLYAVHCASCHLDSLEGSHQAVSLTGTLFADHWHNRTAEELFTRIRTTMPQTRPNSLKPQEYFDITAYLLQANDYAPGPAALDAKSPRLRTPIRASRPASLAGR